MDEIVIDLNGKKIVVKVRISNRARRIGLRVSVKQEVELILPAGVDILIGKSFLLSRVDWISNCLVKHDDMVCGQRLENIKIFDKEYAIRYIDQSEAIKIRLYNDILEIRCLLSESEQLLIGFLKQHLLDKVRLLVDDMSKKHGLTYRSIKLTSGSSKWGSCTSHKALQFNWRLVFADQRIVEYVIAHELAHTKVMNHSHKFWSVVEKLCPYYREAIDWLRNHGHKLHRVLEKYK